MEGKRKISLATQIFIALVLGIAAGLLLQSHVEIADGYIRPIGTAGVPGAGMVMLAMVLASVGLPLDGIALVAGVDRIFDMGRTVVNITGDASCALVVSNLERKKALKKGAA